MGVDDIRELLATQRLLPQECSGNGVERGAVVAQYGARALMRLFDQAVYRRVDAPRRRITVLPGLPRMAGAVTRQAGLAREAVLAAAEYSGPRSSAMASCVPMAPAIPVPCRRSV